MSQIVWQNALSHSVKDSFNNFSDPESRCGWLTKFNQFFFSQIHLSYKKFTMIRSVVFSKVANR